MIGRRGVVGFAANIAGLFALWACGSEGQGEPPPAPDSSADAFADAAPAPDASPRKDAGEDGKAADATVGTTTVTVLGTWFTNVGRSGATVLFHDSSGAVIDRVATGLGGIASTKLQNVDKVTVVSPSTPKLFTWEGVRPGDRLTYLPENTPPYTPLGSLDPGDLTYPGALDYDVNNVFAAQPYTPVPIDWPMNFGAFPGGLTVDVFVEARTATTNFFAVKRGIPTPTGGAAQPVTMGPYVEGRHVTLTVTNAPSNATTTMTYGASFKTGAARALSDGTFAVPEQSDLMQGEVASVIDARNFHGVYVSSALKDAMAIDFSKAIPPATAITRGATQAVDLSWTLPAGLTPTATVASDQWGIAGAEWIIVSPGTTTHVRAPDLPADLADRGPPSTARSGNPAVTLVAFGSKDYAAFRARPVQEITLPRIWEHAEIDETMIFSRSY
jgi:hypothetical protein